jgi:hypothetical protein
MMYYSLCNYLKPCDFIQELLFLSVIFCEMFLFSIGNDQIDSLKEECTMDEHWCYFMTQYQLRHLLKNDGFIWLT